MGLYACDKCFEQFNLNQARASIGHFGVCEICGHTKEDWQTKWVEFAQDIKRPIQELNRKKYILDQLEELNNG